MTQIETKKIIEGLLFGADIEGFLQNKHSEEIVSAEGIILGTKHEPYKFDPTNPFYATSLDNILAEYCIPPCKTAGEYYLAIQKAIEYINSIVPPELVLAPIAAARVNDQYLQTENAKLFGCEASLNCWDGSEVHPQPTGDNLRSSGFHLHFSYNDPKEELSLDICKAMDLFLAVPAVLIEPENERKSVGYGCAGNCRLKSYGGEFRVLSGYFASSKELSEWVFNNGLAAVQFINDGNLRFIQNLGYTIQDCINQNDKQMAEKLIQEFEVPML